MERKGRLEILRFQQYQKLTNLRSVGRFTGGEYPTFDEFLDACSEARVCGNFNGRVEILSDCAKDSYLFYPQV